MRIPPPTALPAAAAALALLVGCSPQGAGARYVSKLRVRTDALEDVVVRLESVDSRDAWLQVRDDVRAAVDRFRAAQQALEEMPEPSAEEKAAVEEERAALAERNRDLAVRLGSVIPKMAIHGVLGEVKKVIEDVAKKV